MRRTPCFPSYGLHDICAIVVCHVWESIKFTCCDTKRFHGSLYCHESLTTGQRFYTETHYIYMSKMDWVTRCIVVSACNTNAYPHGIYRFLGLRKHSFQTILLRARSHMQLAEKGRDVDVGPRQCSERGGALTPGVGDGAQVQMCRRVTSELTSRVAPIRACAGLVKPSVQCGKGGYAEMVLISENFFVKGKSTKQSMCCKKYTSI